MTMPDHLIHRYAPYRLMEAMRLENGNLWPEEIVRTLAIDPSDKTIEFECECGQEFQTEKEAVEHLEKVRD